MRRLFLVAPEPLAGKSTVAAAIALQGRSRGLPVSLERLPGGANEAADKALFSTLSSPGASLVASEAPAGDPSAALASAPDAPVLVVAPATMPPEAIAAFCRTAGDRLSGLVVNRVPRKRMEETREGLRALGLDPLALVLEERVLAAPTLRDVAAALAAEGSLTNGRALMPVDAPRIAPIAVDPGQAYFMHTGAATAIVRSDRPDLQLGALNAGLACLIITGDAPLLTYVRDRAEEEGVVLLRTPLGTVEAVKAIEDLFAALPFAGGEAQLAALEGLARALDPILAS